MITGKTFCVLRIDDRDVILTSELTGENYVKAGVII